VIAGDDGGLPPPYPLRVGPFGLRVRGGSLGAPSLPQKGRRPPHRLALGHRHLDRLIGTGFLHPAPDHFGIEPFQRHDIHTDAGPANPSTWSGRKITSGHPPIRVDASSIASPAVGAITRSASGWNPCATS